MKNLPLKLLAFSLMLSSFSAGADAKKKPWRAIEDTEYAPLLSCSYDLLAGKVTSQDLHDRFGRVPGIYPSNADNQIDRNTYIDSYVENPKSKNAWIRGVIYVSGTPYKFSFKMADVYAHYKQKSAAPLVIKTVVDILDEHDNGTRKRKKFEITIGGKLPNGKFSYSSILDAKVYELGGLNATFDQASNHSNANSGDPNAKYDTDLTPLASNDAERRNHSFRQLADELKYKINQIPKILASERAKFGRKVKHSTERNLEKKLCEGVDACVESLANPRPGVKTAFDHLIEERNKLNCAEFHHPVSGSPDAGTAHHAK